MADLRPEVKRLLDAERDGRIEIEDGEAFEVRGGKTPEEFCAQNGHVYQAGFIDCTICGERWKG